MAITNLGVAAMLVILLRVSTLCAVAHHHGVMTLNGFEKGGDGGGPSECYGKYHSNKEMIVALSTRSYGGGRRCLKMIRITSEQNGRTAQAKVVDECDSSNGCKDSIVDAYAAVWKALGLNANIGEVPVTWTDASNHASIHR